MSKIKRITPSFNPLLFNHDYQKRGAFVVFEGIDRSGKSTQSRLLREYLEKQQIKTVHIGFPQRTTPIGIKINEYLTNTREIDDHELHCLFSDNRWEFCDWICQQLRSGVNIICDRYAFSGVAYSVAKGMNIDLCKQSDEGLPAPDVVIFLDAPVSEVIKRAQFGQERYEKEAFQKKVREVFLQLVNSEWNVLNATKSINELEEMIQSVVSSKIKEVENRPIHRLW